MNTKMLEQRPYVDEKMAYVYGLYENSLKQESKDSNLLKLNIERSFMKISELDHELLSIQDYKKLCKEQEYLELQKSQIIDKIGINNQLLQMLREKKKSDQLITNSLNTLEILNAKYITIDQKLNSINKKLQSHIMSVASLSSIQNLVVGTGTDKSYEFGGTSYLDELVSHIASVAAQRNITLPLPSGNEDSSDSKIEWVKSCIDSIFLLPMTEHVNGSKDLLPSNNDSKEIIGLKTLLNDLQFAHQYLTKQFEEARSVSTLSMSNLRLKLQDTQDLLSNANKELGKQTQNLINLDIQLNQEQLLNAQKTKEIAELNKKIAFLQIDHLGESTMTPPSSKDEEIRSPLSPVTNFGFENLSLRNDSNLSVDNNSGNISSSIIRLEFKKLLNDINAKHEAELQNEQNERKKLENLIKMMKDN